MPRARPALGFPKSRRLLSAGDYQRVFKQGRRLSLPEFTLAWRLRTQRAGAGPRLGLSVSRKAGSSVERNLLKRRLREIFRLHRARMDEGAELVFIPRKEAAALSYRGLEERFLALLGRGRLLKPVA